MVQDNDTKVKSKGLKPPKLKTEAARVNSFFELENRSWLHEDMPHDYACGVHSAPVCAFFDAAYFCVWFYLRDTIFRDSVSTQQVGDHIYKVRCAYVENANDDDVKLSDPEIFEIARWQMERAAQYTGQAPPHAGELPGLLRMGMEKAWSNYREEREEAAQDQQQKWAKVKEAERNRQEEERRRKEEERLQREKVRKEEAAKRAAEYEAQRPALERRRQEREARAAAEKAAAERRAIEERVAAARKAWGVVAAPVKPGAPRVYIKAVLEVLRVLYLAGPRKVVKSGMALDLIVSVLSGKPWLGFDDFGAENGEGVEVVYFSGELEKDKIDERIARICRAKGVDPSDAMKRITVINGMPYPADEFSMNQLRDLLARKVPTVVVIDALYRCINQTETGEGAGVNMTDKTAVARVLENLEAVCRGHNATLVILDHLKKETWQGVWPDFRHISGAGIGEYIRQWVLVNRKGEYVQGSGHHDLMLRIGSDSNTGRDVRVEIDEGPGLDRWEVSVTPRQVKKTAAGQEEGEQAGEAAQLAVFTSADQGDDQKAMNAIVAAIPALAGANGVAGREKVRKTVNERHGLKLTPPKMVRLVQRLAKDGRIELADTAAGAKGLRLPPQAQAS
jgi:hypothetical protein